MRKIRNIANAIFRYFGKAQNNANANNFTKQPSNANAYISSGVSIDQIKEK